MYECLLSFFFLWHLPRRNKASAIVWHVNCMYCSLTTITLLRLILAQSAGRLEVAYICWALHGGLGSLPSTLLLLLLLLNGFGWYKGVGMRY